MIARKYRILICALGVCAQVKAMNLLVPYDTLIRPDYTHNYRFQLGLFAETGLSDRGFNQNGNANALRIWNCDQDTLAMLDGFPVDSPQGQKRVAVDANDDGTRGHFLLDGKLALQFAGAFSGRLFLGKDWSLGLYMPFYSMKLKNVRLVDQTNDITDEDVRVHQLLTDNIVQNICELGDGLQIGDWERTGPGDTALLVEWFREFPQAKPFLKSVRLNWRGGLSLPTGFRCDEDKLFAIPYGSDGALGIPFGMGLDLSFAWYMRLGFQVTLTQFFGNTRSRRIKTSPNQTELFLLQKTDVYKDFGLTQNFNLYAQLYRFIRGFSFMVGYEYMKQNRDTISVCGNGASTEIANSAESLKDWTMHEFVFKADYDIGLHMKTPKVYPRIALYSRLPFNGKRAVANTVLGMTFSLDF